MTMHAESHPLVVGARSRDRRLRDPSRHPRAGARAAAHAHAARRHARRLRYDAARRRQGARRRGRGAVLVAWGRHASRPASTTSKRALPTLEGHRPAAAIPATPRSTARPVDRRSRRATPVPAPTPTPAPPRPEIAANGPLARRKRATFPTTTVAGMTLVRQGAYDKAIQSLRDFLRTNRSRRSRRTRSTGSASRTTCSADYYQAILNFNQVRQQHPKSDRAPAAVLKIGLAFQQMGNKSEAQARFPEGHQRLPVLAGGGSAERPGRSSRRALRLRTGRVRHIATSPRRFVAPGSDARQLRRRAPRASGDSRRASRGGACGRRRGGGADVPSASGGGVAARIARRRSSRRCATGSR